MSTVNEIAPDVYRISIYVSEFNLQFNHFLIKDDQPLLYHTGMKGMYPLVRSTIWQSSCGKFMGTRSE